MEKFRVLIPAHYASTRLEGKVLLDIAGKPMLQHVYERVKKSRACSVVIATDDKRIEEAAENFGADVCRTLETHLSGTSRLAEAIEILGYPKDDIIVGVQADEPLISPSIIDQVAENLSLHDKVKTATLCTRIYSVVDIFDPNVVKVIMDKFNCALYFSRAPIPWNRAHFAGDRTAFSPVNHYRHLGIYAYRGSFLKKYVDFESAFLEEEEALEQLRILWYGEKIHVTEAKEFVPKGVDSREDLDRVREILLANKS